MHCSVCISRGTEAYLQGPNQARDKFLASSGIANSVNHRHPSAGHVLGELIAVAKEGAERFLRKIVARQGERHQRMSCRPAAAFAHDKRIIWGTTRQSLSSEGRDTWISVSIAMRRGWRRVNATRESSHMHAAQRTCGGTKQMEVASSNAP